MGGDWVMYHTDDGRPYYENLVTQSTVWEKPNGFEEDVEEDEDEEDEEVEVSVFCRRVDIR